MEELDADGAYVVRPSMVERRVFFCTTTKNDQVKYQAWFESAMRHTRKDDVRKHERLDGIGVDANTLANDLPPHLALIIPAIDELDPIDVNDELKRTRIVLCLEDNLKFLDIQIANKG